MTAFSILLTIDFWSTALVAAAPMLLAMLGASIAGRAGIVNYAAEGLFVAGAFAGLAFAGLGQGPWSGFFGAATIGAGLGVAAGLAFARLPQAACGLGATLVLAAGAQAAFGLLYSAGAPAAPSFDSIDWSKLLGPMPGGIAPHGPIVSAPFYVSLACAALLGYVVNRTPLGLAFVACGDNPDALSTQGRSVALLRLTAVAAGSALIAAGGATFVLSVTNGFSFGVLNGRGFAALALALAVGWRVRFALIAAVLFGVADTLEWRLQAGDPPAAGPWLSLMPMTLTLVAFTALSARSAWASLASRRAKPKPATSAGIGRD